MGVRLGLGFTVDLICRVRKESREALIIMAFMREWNRDLIVD